MNDSFEYEQLELYVLGELPPDETARIEARLSDDPAAQQELQSAKRLLDALDQSLAEPQARPDLADQIIARLSSELPRTSASRQTSRRRSKWTQLIRKADVIPIAVERIRRMNRIAKFTVAATVLVALGILTSRITVGGSTNIALAQVADALDGLRSATFDVTTKSIGENGQPAATETGKGFFLAPSRQRIEMSVNAAVAKSMSKMQYITIVDGQAAKGITLMPVVKTATTMDMSKMRDDMKKSGKLAEDPACDMFETVRRLVREGSSGTAGKVERLGKKEIDGREAVGFRTDADGTSMVLWADPETAWPIRVEMSMDLTAGAHMVMNNFRYNVDLDPSLFSLEPPQGYSTQTIEMAMPVEEDLLRTLRAVAEHGTGVFPAELKINKEVMGPPVIEPPAVAEAKPEPDKLTKEKMEAASAAMERVVEKYGGREKIKAKYGKDIPPAIMAEVRDAAMPFMKEIWEHQQMQMPKQMPRQMPINQYRLQQVKGISFYVALESENDPHYVGSGVKLGTPDCPILWYKPTGADHYRVIYADLSVKDMAPDDVKKLPGAAAK